MKTLSQYPTGKKAGWQNRKEKLLLAEKMENSAVGLKDDHVKSPRLPRRKSLQPLAIGNSFGRLVVQRVFYLETGGERMVKYLCSCGNSGEKKAAGLLSGMVKSCGCLRKESARQRGAQSKIHGNYCGKAPDPLYAVWKAMMARCHNSRNKQFKDYGGRGIFVCPEWQGVHGFTTFVQQMGRPPSKEHSLDRKDNNLGYSVDNCQWATRKQQGYNKRNNQWVSVGGHHFILSEWERKLNLKRGALHSKNSELRKSTTCRTITDFIYQKLQALYSYAPTDSH